MTTRNAFEKRLRRRITGRKHTFFIGTAPGFEGLCYEELASLSLDLEEVTVVDGGIEFQGRVHDCYQANLLLRTAGRILMRLDEFKATNFGKLCQ